MTLLYTCSNLPTGASLASSGRLIVLPTAAAGTTALSITITDSITGDVGSGTVSLVVSSLVTAAYFGLQLPISLSADFALTASVAVAAQALSVIDIALTAGVTLLQQVAVQVDFALTATVRYSAAGLPVDFALTATSAPASFSTALASIRSSAGMTQIVSAYADDANIVLPPPGFAVPVYGGSYQSNIFIVSNSYLTFGYSTSVFSGLSLTVPGLALMLAAADRSWLSVYVNQDSAKSYRILWNGGASSGGTSPYSWQVVLWADGTIEFAYDAAFPTSGVKALTKGDGATSSSFTTTAGVAGSYVFTPVDAAASSYAVQAGSYVSNAAAAPVVSLAGSTAQPQVLAGLLAIGSLLAGAATQPQVLSGSLSNAPPGLAGSVSQPQALAGSVAVSKLLTGAVSQPQTLTGGLNVSVLGRNKALLNAVSYSAINNSSYSYYSSTYQMPAMYDGNLTSGVMGQAVVAAEAFYVQVQLGTASFINQLIFYGGQFNGSYNCPDSVKIYAGLVGAGTTATPLYSNNALTYSTTGQILPLTEITAFDVPFTQLTFAFATAGQYVYASVAELQIRGYSTFASNIAQPQSLTGALSVT